MNKPKIYLFEIGGLDAIYNGYEGRYLSIVKYYKNAEIVTSRFIHSKKKTTKKKYKNYKTYECGSYLKNIGFERFIYNFRYLLNSIKYSFKIKKGSICIINSIPPDLFFLILLLKFRGIKVVLDMRDVWLPQNNNFFSLIYIYLIISKLLTRLSISLSDKVISTSEKYFLNFKIENKKVFYLGFDKPFKLNKVKFNNSLYYIGNESNQYDLIKSISKISNDFTELKVFGNFSENYIRKCYSSLINKKFNLKFYGHCSSEVIFNEIRNSNFGILPNIQNSLLGVPNKFFDYLKFGHPVIYINENNENNEIIRLINYGFGITLSKFLKKNHIYKNNIYKNCLNFVKSNRFIFSKTKINKNLIDYILK